MSVTFSAYDETAYEFVGEGINMANANAAHVLDALGLDVVDLAGQASAEDFLGRVLMALAVAPTDEGVPTHEIETRGHVQWIEGGRAPGYLQERLAQLHELALSARKHGCVISWA